MSDASPDPVRERVLDALSLIAASDRIAAVRPDLPPGRIPYLLCQMWFDAVYVPGTRYMDGLKGDRIESEARRFLGGFDEDEERWLERFNRFLELRVDRLTPSNRADRIFPDGERWGNVVRDAGHLIDLLGGHSRDGRRLEDVARTLLPEAPP